ncbi:type II secretion system F family protein [Pseudoteredinibacter isoporae]|uniref:General secretion pathway protein F n=1 Tax=Pseudoteredinibacter isoporae TaxID=570281 RepID=A0A7X0JRK6_9GAMM|nr:type II secretion system F family protein [Pseudoteredinibacter isoporae]MBB6521004.1 general secretion pathway protein F [Pseudoteredinibacter isoporae]NHO86569.1 type II secretion system F family protein [Pseudoteredinibacter isoporae]NIB24979.1 type II secretion system F family protein [Pseudoteredinibacter isoporae]
MGEFSYKAADRQGAMVHGNITAASKELAVRNLRQQGLTPVTVNEGAQKLKADPSSVRLSREQVLNVTSELSVLLRAGLPIDRALKVLIDMSQEEEPKAVLEALLKTVKGGKGLSVGLEQYERDFGGFYVNMVRSGEASGNLSHVLQHLTEYLENAKEVRSSVVSALIYPGILMGVAVLSIAFMLGFVVPQFESLFADMGDALPAMTAAVIAAGDFIKGWWWLLLILIAAIVWYVRHWVNTEDGEYRWHGILLKMPILGGVLFKYEMANFSRTVGTLLGSGVSLLQALTIGINTVGNRHVKESLVDLPPAVKQGHRISATMESNGSFTPKVVQIIRVGEESGSLDEMMLELARVYDGDVQVGVKRALTFIEPVLILFMGGAIALIIIAILMGIISVNNLV